MSDFFVGFRPSPKMPKGLVPFQAEHTIVWQESPGAVFNFLTQREFVDQWLSRSVKFDARQGGKLKFSTAEGEEFGGTYSRLAVPRHVVLQTELHGELKFTLREVGEHGEADLVATMLGKPEEKEAWHSRIVELVASLERCHS